MMLLRLISLPYARRHVLRTVLTIAGIVLGVAVFVAMQTANEAVLSSFSRTVEQIAGVTQLEVWAGDFGFEEGVLEKVQAVPEVRVAVPVVEAAVGTGRTGKGNLLILGVDMTGDRSLRRYDFDSGDEDIIDDPLVFLAQPDSILITREFAARSGLAVSSRLPLVTMEGVKQFVVRGIMRSEGFAKAFGGNVAVMDVYAAQHMFGRGRRFDRIDVGVREDVPVERAQAAIRAVVGPGFEVEPPSARGQHFEAMLKGYRTSMNISSVFALFIGMFIIYNSFAISVTQRRYEIGVLRALGATQRQIRWVFLGEAAIAGAVGSVVGVLAGTALARATAAYLGAFFENVYGVAQRVEQAPVELQLTAIAVAMGMLTSVIAAWIPTRAAAHVDPVQALQKGKYQVLSAGENRIRRIVAAVLFVASTLCMLTGKSTLVFYSGYAGAILTSLLLVPSLSLWLVHILRPALKRFRPVEGALAADSLIQAPKRTSATVSALMLSLAMVIGFAGMAESIFRSVVEWMDTRLNPDLFVTPSERISNRQFSFPGNLAAEVERIEGVEMTQNVKSARVLYRGTPVTVVSLEFERFAKKVRFHPIAGDLDEMYRLAGAEKGVILSDSLAGLRGLKLGEMVELPAPAGILRLPVVGIARDFSDQQGTVMIDRSVYKQWWKDDSVHVIRVYLKPGASLGDVKRRIFEKFSDRRRLFVLENREVRRDIIKWTNEWFAMTYNQIGIAVLVAVLGIVNTLTVSITDRRRELGVLQAVGGLRNQIRHTIWMEAVSIGLLGLILGLALGAVNLRYVMEVTRQLGGMQIDYVYPLRIGLLLTPAMLVTAFVSSLWPAETAVRGSLVEALEYE